MTYMGFLCTSRRWDLSSRDRQLEPGQQLPSLGTLGLTQTSSRIKSSGGPRNPNTTRWPSGPMLTLALCVMYAVPMTVGPLGLAGSPLPLKRS